MNYAISPPEKAAVLIQFARNGEEHIRVLPPAHHMGAALPRLCVLLRAAEVHPAPHLNILLGPVGQQLGLPHIWPVPALRHRHPGAEAATGLQGSEFLQFIHSYYWHALYLIK